MQGREKSKKHEGGVFHRQERPGFKKGHITLKQMERFVSQIPDPSKVVLYMAGVGGDPMMNPEAVEIFRGSLKKADMLLSFSVIFF